MKRSIIAILVVGFLGNVIADDVVLDTVVNEPIIDNQTFQPKNPQMQQYFATNPELWDQWRENNRSWKLLSPTERETARTEWLKQYPELQSVYTSRQMGMGSMQRSGLTSGTMGSRKRMGRGSQTPGFSTLNTSTGTTAGTCLYGNTSGTAQRKQQRMRRGGGRGRYQF